MRVVWRSENALFDGVSPAPKQGPQNAVLTVTPDAISSAAAPLRTSSMNTGMLDGYADTSKPALPTVCPFRMDAAAQRFSNVPPAQPAMMP